MRCKHNRIRIWNRKNGWTEKCLDCGRRRHGHQGPPSAFRKYIPGLMDLSTGTVALIDVTSSQGETIYGEWVK